ncbi:peptidoglycan/xylan/chitin deacetylase (PgdA/CDA1 family) [Pseudarthrobacter defluvii]|uniref:polysaccharide deacetylase family protein n=1 Tax=Pseudarthrobacter defluvii TaxID=410837 RepID=UPI00278000FC|nr:polysaccharide deacetylase family protein [Pseudarthrobacter defluvii]MDQ0767555.1 peptidoglycan/xylan/chitin deacetylase (PgdA/CDA1 family) [Pseudarthrobacter defluvii]
MKSKIAVMALAALSLILALIAGGPAASAQAADKPLIGLTFDDGPSAERTAFVLDVLKEKNVKATFFLQGSHVQQYPDLVRRIKAEGHVIGNHSWDHANFPDLTQANQKQEVDRTNTAIKAITGTTPTLMRFPFGNSTSYALNYLRNIGMSGGIQWHWEVGEPGDYECPGAAGVQKYVLDEVAPGAIILLHDGNDVLSCPASQWNYLSSTIDAIRAEGYEFGVVAPSSKPSALNEGSYGVVVAP